MRILLAVVLTGCVVHTDDLIIDDPPIVEPPPPPSAARGGRWSGCMGLADFHAADMAASWGTLRADNGQQCIGCHDGGSNGFFVTTNERLFFDNLTQHRFVMATYFRFDLATNNVVANTDLFFNAATKLPAHPAFQPDNPAIQALIDFTASTQSHFASNECGPSRLTD